MEEVADDSHEQRLQPPMREVVQEQKEAAGGRSAAEGEAIMRKDMEGKKNKKNKNKIGKERCYQYFTFSMYFKQLKGVVLPNIFQNNFSSMEKSESFFEVPKSCRTNLYFRVFSVSIATDKPVARYLALSGLRTGPRTHLPVCPSPSIRSTSALSFETTYRGSRSIP